MTYKQLEEFITDLDHASRDKCVIPENQTINCSNCYPCRVSYFNWVREDMTRKFGIVNKEI